MGYDVSPNVNKGRDLIVDGKKVEVKGSTLSSSFNNEFQFKFMQIRMNSDWDEMILLAVWPRDCRMFSLSRDAVQHYIDTGVIVRQHGGEGSNNDTFIFIGDPAGLDMSVEVEPKVKPVKGDLVA